MRYFLISILFICFVANAQTTVYSRSANYAVNYNNAVYDLTIDSPYTWFLNGYSTTGNITNIEVLFSVTNTPTKCHIFSRTYSFGFIGDFYNTDSALKSILDQSKQAKSYPDNSGKVFVYNSSGGTHDAIVAINVAAGYGIDTLGVHYNYTINGSSVSTTQNVKNWLDSNIVFDAHFTVDAVSYAKLTNAIAEVNSNCCNVISNYKYYPSVQVFAPLGSNSHILLDCNTSPKASCGLLNVIASGASRSDTNFTAYGKGLEFIAPASASSFSNGYIAGQLLKIYQSRGHNWWNARYAARMTASHNGVWDIKNGYGIINVNAAINYNGTVPPCPYPTF